VLPGGCAAVQLQATELAKLSTKIRIPDLWPPKMWYSTDGSVYSVDEEISVFEIREQTTNPL